MELFDNFWVKMYLFCLYRRNAALCGRKRFTYEWTPLIANRLGESREYKEIERERVLKLLSPIAAKKQLIQLNWSSLQRKKSRISKYGDDNFRVFVMKEREKELAKWITTTTTADASSYALVILPSDENDTRWETTYFLILTHSLVHLVFILHSNVP